MALSKRTKFVVFVFAAVVVADIVLFALFFRGCTRDAARTGAAERPDAREVELAGASIRRRPAPAARTPPAPEDVRAQSPRM